MPKVSKEYYEKKRREIIDAAYRVCTRKPITSVEMKDIIAETGFSHGVIYRYYRDLDEVLKDLVVTINEDNRINDTLDEILSKRSSDDWENTIYDLCAMLGDQMKGMGTDLVKVSIYCDMLAMADPERAMKINENIDSDEQTPFLYAVAVISEFMMKAIKKNKLKPSVSVDQIIEFFIVHYHGIQTGFVLSESFKVEEFEGKFKVEDMFINLATSIILMMGGKAKTK